MLPEFETIDPELESADHERGAADPALTCTRVVCKNPSQMLQTNQKFRKVRNSIHVRIQEHVNLSFKVSQGLKICFLTKSGKCHFDFQSFARSQHVLADQIWKMPF